MNWYVILAALVGVISIVQLFKATYKHVPPAHVQILEKWGGEKDGTSPGDMGKYIRVLEAGNHFICPIPYISHLGKSIPVNDQTIRFEIGKDQGFGGKGKVHTKDSAMVVTAQAVIRVTDPIRAAFAVGDYFTASLEQIESAIRHYYADQKMDDALKIDTEINDDMRHECDGMLKEWGVEFRDFAVVQIEVDPETEKVRLKPQVAEKEAIVKRTEAAAERDSRVMLAEGDRQAKIILAEGESQASVKLAEADSSRINTIATGNNVPTAEAMAFLLNREAIGALKNATVVFSAGQDGSLVSMLASVTATQAGMNRQKTGGNGEAPKADSDAKGGEKA